MSDHEQHADIVFGDPTFGGHEPTPEELARLRGRQPNGIPKGLIQCHTCGEWYGECFWESLGLVVRARCRCDAQDRCRRCGAALYHHAIGSTYYVPSEDAVHHVPWFMGMKHEKECPERQRRNLIDGGTVQ
jgi:hypothetical protein